MQIKKHPTEYFRESTSFTSVWFNVAKCLLPQTSSWSPARLSWSHVQRIVRYVHVDKVRSQCQVPRHCWIVRPAATGQEQPRTKVHSATSWSPPEMESILCYGERSYAWMSPAFLQTLRRFKALHRCTRHHIVIVCVTTSCSFVGWFDAANTSWRRERMTQMSFSSSGEQLWQLFWFRK